MEQIGPLSPVQQQHMETIDRVQSEAMVTAESKCSKFCMGEIDFLVNLNTIRGQRLCWQMIVKQHSGGKVSLDKIR
jgi:hypothetical protein